MITKTKPKVLNVNLTEIHQYADDLKIMHFLRDKCTDNDEIERYDDIIEVMQRVMVELNRIGVENG